MASATSDDTLAYLVDGTPFVRWRLDIGARHVAHVGEIAPRTRGCQP